MTISRPILYLAKGKLYFPYYLSLKLPIPGHLNFPFSQHVDNTVKVLKYSKLDPFEINERCLSILLSFNDFIVIIIIIIIVIIK